MEEDYSFVDIEREDNLAVSQLCVCKLGLQIQAELH